MIPFAQDQVGLFVHKQAWSLQALEGDRHI